MCVCVCVCVYIYNVSDIDDCESVTCLNGGNCTDGVNQHTCVCEAGYTGPHCETGKYSNNMKIYF